MGSPVSTVIANIYMDYFEEVALGTTMPHPHTMVEVICG